MHEIIKLLHESILLETVTLVIYTVWAYGARFIHFMYYFSISCHVLLTYLIGCPKLGLPYLLQVFQILIICLWVFVVGSPFWRYLIFISFKPLRSIYIKHLYSIIFNIRALICLISCLFAYWMKFVYIQIDINRGGRFVPPFVFPSIFDSKRLL